MSYVTNAGLNFIQIFASLTKFILKLFRKKYSNARVHNLDYILVEILDTNIIGIQ